jgi:2-amino-4-hydroxy-6-hydroxymethyldihydropteridine diphosphokinase
MQKLNKVQLSLGGNVGDVRSNIEKAYRLIEKKCGTITHKSTFYQTPAWGMKEGTPDFTNSAIILESDLKSNALLIELQKIEKELGRIRDLSNPNYIDRTLDIDIIFFNNEIINTKTLIVPHQHMHKRKFVLEPICEINPNYIHPELNKSVKDLLEKLINDENSLS